MQLRKLNELQKKEEQEILEMRSAPKKKGLKRSMSFTSLCISGHIFDTRFFNDTLDILETAKANFVVLNMRIGQREEEESSASLQIFSHDTMRFNTALDKIYELAEGLPVKITKTYDEKPGENE
jgi:ACT domain-containing protein